MNYREKLFWLKDIVETKPISRHYHDIKDFFTRDTYRERNTKVGISLNNIISHVKNSTEYYYRSDFQEISEFPIINKNTIRNDFNSFISSNYLRPDLRKVTTSGSTGTPFSIYQDRNKRHRNTADVIYFGEMGGYKIGEKLCYFKIWSSLNYKSKFKRWSENIECFDVLNLAKDCEAVIKSLNQHSGSMYFMGYSSAFETICKYLDFNQDTKLDVKAKGVITISEALNQYTKEKITQYFGCDAYSRYSNIENGILAQQLSGVEWFRINHASYYLEIIDENSNRILPEGHLGRIVVTDLYNYGMPLVRYDTGDMGLVETIDIDGQQELVLKRIEGRKLDQIYNTKGELISSYIVYKNMFQYTELLQYQFIQKSETLYTLKLIAPNGFSREEKLINEFNEYLGQDAKITIEYVAEIPLLSSGKRKKVINLMESK